MIQKTWIGIALLLSVALWAQAKKKKKSCVRFIRGTYSSTHSPKRIIGTIYELDVETACVGLKIDSVWFGFAPVPCDVLQLNTRNKVDSCKARTTYRVRANKDLYKNFPGKFDSLTALRQFKPPFPFTGEAVIFYKVDGKRYYCVAKGLTEKAAKPYRE